MTNARHAIERRRRTGAGGPPGIAGAAAVLLVLAAALASRVTAQDAAWGTAVEGVSLHLGLAADPANGARGGLPALEVQLRNEGAGVVTFRPEAIVHGSLEVDGVWYVETWGGSCCSGPLDIAPSATSAALPLLVVPANMFRIDRGAARRLDLRPGRHRLRVRSVSSDTFDIHTPLTDRLVVVSNVIVVAVGG